MAARKALIVCPTYNLAATEQEKQAGLMPKPGCDKDMLTAASSSVNSQSSQMSSADQLSKLQAIQPFMRALEMDLSPTSKTECGPYDLAGIAQPGDHIAVRSVTKGTTDVIWHHGIYMGNSQVVHMHPSGNISGVGLSEFAVTHITADTYIDKAAIVNYRGDSPQFKALTQIIASWTTSDPTMKSIEYDGLRANCDGFACWCRTGRCEGPTVTKLLANVPVSPFLQKHPKF